MEKLTVRYASWDLSSVYLPIQSAHIGQPIARFLKPSYGANIWAVTRFEIPARYAQSATKPVGWGRYSVSRMDVVCLGISDLVGRTPEVFTQMLVEHVQPFMTKQDCGK